MGIVRKQGFNNLIISYAGIAIGYLNMAILFPRLLTQEVFGLTQVLLSAMLFVSNIGSLGLQFIIVRYYHIFKAKLIENKTFLTITMIITLVGIVLSCLSLFVFQSDIKDAYSEKAALFSEYYVMMYPLAIFGILSVFIDSYSRAVLKSVFTAFHREVMMRLLQLLLAVFLFLEVYNLDTFVALFTLIQGLYVMVMFISIGRNHEVIPALNINGLTKPVLKDMAKFGGVSMFSTTALLSNNVDILLVGSLLGLKATAVYSVAASIGKVLAGPARAMNRVAASLIAEAWALNDVAKVDRLYSKSAITSMITGIILFLVVALNMDLLISFLPSDYAGVELIVIVVALSKLVQVATGLSAGVISSSKDYAMNMYINTIGFLMLIGFSYIFIMWKGMLGAALAMLVVQVINNLMRFGFLFYKYNMQPFTSSYLISVLIGSLIYAAHLILPNIPHLFADSFVRSAIGLGLYIWMNYRLNVSKDFTESIDLAFKKIKNRL